MVPKDFDIASMATPREIKKSVPNSYIIGKRFKLVLAKRRETMYELATFRKLSEVNAPNSDEAQTDNAFGGPEEDANRRDFTINGLFYDPFSNDLIDYVNGLEDLRAHKIRMIGEPKARLLEDPIRILRCIRLSLKINFVIDKALIDAIKETAGCLSTAPLPRIRLELVKFLKLQDPVLSFLVCKDLNVLDKFSPTLADIFNDETLKPPFVKALKTMPFKLYKDFEDPLELFALLTYQVIRTKFYPDKKQKLKIDDILEHKEIVKFMKFEMGLYNHEQELIARAFSLRSKLINDKSYQSEKVLLNMVKNDAFSLSFLFSHLDDILPHEKADILSDKYKELIKSQ